MAIIDQNRFVDAARRYLTLKTHKIYSLPIVILMPHSGCNCRCLMCNIWQDRSQRRLDAADIAGLITSLRQLGTRWVVLSGGEALMNPRLFQLCRLLEAEGLKLTLLSTGLLLGRYAPQVIEHTDEVIVSLDGSEAIHNAIRRIPNAFQKLHEGVQTIKRLAPDFRITARCVIQRLNFRDWPGIIEAAQTMGLDQISFLAADVSSEAFNRADPGDAFRVAEVRPDQAELPALQATIDTLISDCAASFEQGFIAETPAKIRRIYDYYAALHGLAAFPPVRCNAPWVSAVVEADGAVRPCFFHHAIGNIREAPLHNLVNRPEVASFRQSLDMDTDPICRRCVCSLNLRPTAKLE